MIGSASRATRGTEGRWQPAEIVSRPCRPDAGGGEGAEGGWRRLKNQRPCFERDPLVPDEGDSCMSGLLHNYMLHTPE